MEKGRTVLITGASSGIGKAVSEEFLDHCWKVASIEVDEGVQYATSWLKRIPGSYDAMVLNAGVQYFGLKEEFAYSLDLILTNIMGVYYGLFFASQLLKIGSPICVVSSNAAYTADKSSPLYHASKSAVSSLVHSFSLIHVGKFRVFGVCPGLVPTDIGGTGGAVPEDLISKVPVGRVLDPQELAGYIFKLMFEFPYLVGEDIVLDGGLRWIK